MRATALISLIASLGLLSACGASSADSAAGQPAASTTSARISSALDQAWSLAKAGDNPTMACVKVKGYAISDESSSAHAAQAQCNFDIPVRYFNALLDQVDNGSLSCRDFMTSMATQLRGMTLSMGGLKHAAATHTKSDADANAAATKVIAGAITGNTSKQASSKVKASLRERTVSACPVMTMYMQS